MKVGVLAIQGSVREHVEALERAGAEVRYVRTCEDLRDVDGLVMPGGESTTITKLMKLEGMDKEIKSRAKKGMPIYGTCAGAILLSHGYLDIADIDIERNAYGRQLDSFEEDVRVFALGQKPFHAIFIRAPKITRTGDQVEILAKHDKEVIMCRQEKILISTFHPELTGDSRVHDYFLKICDGSA